MTRATNRAFSPRRAVLVAATMFVILSLVTMQLVNVTARAEEPAADAFERTWARTDKPVSDGAVRHTWMWGPEPFTVGLWETYDESPGGQRLVQYYDKGRMEITDPDAVDDGLWYVTTGLLVVELMTGQMQVGETRFEPRVPAEIPVAGDPDDMTGPTYATFADLRYLPPYSDGQAITLRVARDGTVTDDPSLAGRGVTAGYRVQLDGLDHQVASPFWAFMNSTGTVYEDGEFVEDLLFENPFYATGYPIAEAYWANVKVAGQQQDVLVQCFERRCLTYTPANDPGWQVEAGNIGQHYYEWRDHSEPVEPTPTEPVEPTSTMVPTEPVAPTEPVEPTATTGPTEPAAPTVAPTNTATPTREPEPTATSTRTPTRTPTPTEEPEPTETPDDVTPTPEPIGSRTESGRASVTPWSGFWWPFRESASPNLYDDGRTLDKYDAYVEATYGYNPGSKEWEKANHYGGASWWGHCQAWAAASFMEPEPRAVTKNGVSFTQDEAEGLITETYFAPNAQIWGKECNDCETTSAAYMDVAPAVFDSVMREQMGRNKKNVIMDMDPGSEVWNYPSYRYTRESEFRGDLEYVTMTVTIALPAINQTGTRDDDVTYTYTLKSGTDGEWTGNSVDDHPDFVWIVNGRTRAGGGANPKVDYAVVKEILR